MSDLLTVLNQLTGRGGGEPLTLDPLPATRTVLAVGGTILPAETVDEHHRRCFQLAQDAVKALRLATNAHIPNLRIQRVWPLYVILVENEPGNVIVHNLMIVERGFANTATATDEKLREAAAVLRAGWLGSPVELYRDYELSAQNAAWVEGDYGDAVLKAAVAAEVLLKHAAWLLIWEATEELAADPAPATSPFDPFAARPSQLIGSVLSSRLHGDWSSQDETKPIGAWRFLIAKRRTAVIHGGYRPNEREVRQTIEALHRLEQHVLNRLAVMAKTYPRTAVLLVGRPGLERRGVWQEIQSSPGDDRSLPALTRSYLDWLNARLDDDAGS
jgi:hypothetical protein